MRWLAVWLVTLLAGCHTYANVKAFLDERPHRTVWQVCWSDEGEILPPSDTYPHEPVCDSPEIIKWSLPVRVFIAHEEEADHIRVAMKQWNAWVGKEIFVEARYTFDVIVLDGGYHPFFAGMANVFRDHGRLAGAVTLWLSGEDEKYHYEVILHEFGHILGLAHDVNDPRGFLMSPGATGKGTMIAPEDARFLQELYSH